jgi:N-methylhydantoinase A
MAASLGIQQVIVPPAPGLFSSFGLLYADVEHHYSRTFRRLLREADLQEIESAWRHLVQQASAQLEIEGFTGKRAKLRRSAALHYKGQTFDLVIPVPAGPIDGRMVAHLEEAFGEEHQKTYGHRAGSEEPVELVSLQVVGQGLRESGGVPERILSSRTESPREAPRRVYFGPAYGWIETPIFGRADLAGGRTGPAIIEEYDATCVIPPRASAHLDAGGNIVIELELSATQLVATDEARV